MTTTTDRPRIEVNNLKGFNKEIADLIKTAVNEDGCAWKQTRRGILLYPLDDSRPLTLVAHSGTHMVAQLNDWHRKHVLPHLKSPLVAAVEAATQTKAEEAHEYADNLRDHVDRLLPEEIEFEEGRHPWRQWMGVKGEAPVEGIEFNGVAWRCALCMGTDHEWISRSAAGIGGHRRAHIPALAAAAANAKMVETRRNNKMAAQVEEAIRILLKAVGWEDQSQQIEALLRDNAELRARLDLVEEAMRA